MRALLQGRRNATVGVVLGLVGMLCLLAVTTGLAIYGMTNLHHLRSTIYQRCLQRQTYDRANHDGQVANAEVWRALADITSQVKLPLTADAQSRRLYASEVKAIETAKVKAQAAADAGVIGTCKAYR